MSRGSQKHVTLCKTSLYDAIEEKKLSPATVSEMLGMQRDYVANIFVPSRKGDIAYSSALAIASVVGKNLGDLLVKETVKKEAPAEQKVDLTYINNRLSNIETELADLHKTLKSIGSIEMEMLNTIKEVWGCK